MVWETEMAPSDLLRRLRGVLTSGLLSTGVGALFGAVVGLMGLLLEPNNCGWDCVLGGVVGLGSFGLLCGTGFALFLTLTSFGQRLPQVPRLRVLLLGVISGMLPTTVLYLGGVPDFVTLGELLFPVLLGGSLGGLGGMGFVEFARRAPPRLTSGESALDRMCSCSKGESSRKVRPGSFSCRE